LEDHILAEYLGYAAGILTTFCYIPQIIRVFKLRSSREISLTYTLLLLGGVIIWLLYGIFLKLPPIILWNSIALVMAGLLVFAKVFFGRQQR
jgi:MtN3 and saliva related transmembrane protein